ncbi:unnamed protein product [Closterium sp. NIES-53]
MTTPKVLRFDAEVQADESLWKHASGGLPKPDDPAPLSADPSSADKDRYARQRADLTACKSRDVAACIALSSLLPESEEAHFTQVRTTSEFLTAIKARYATPTTVSLGRLFLPFLFPYLASFKRSAVLITHLRSLDSSYRAACTDAQLALLPPPLAITIYFIATSLPDRLASVRERFFLSTLVSSLSRSLSLSSVSALTAPVTEFATTRRLDYATCLVAAPPTSPQAVGEMASYRSTGTYVDEVPPPGTNVVDGMWIFKVKWPPGSPPVLKARYVARGFSQREGVDFFQTFAPTPNMTTLRVLLHIAAQRDYELHSLDFSTAFLRGSLYEEAWLCRPSAFTGTFPPGTQWRLRRLVYGLRQAPREWHDTFRSTMSDLGFQPSSADPSLFVRRGSTLFFVLVYVDDLVFANADRVALANVKRELQKRHTCTDLGELRQYLRLQC